MITLVNDYLLQDAKTKKAVTGKRVVVIGSSHGTELAVSLAQGGKGVTLLEESPRFSFAPYIALTITRMLALGEYLAKNQEHLKVRTGIRVEEIVDGGVRITSDQGESELIEADTVMFAPERLADRSLTMAVRERFGTTEQMGQWRMGALRGSRAAGQRQDHGTGNSTVSLPGPAGCDPRRRLFRADDQGRPALRRTIETNVEEEGDSCRAVARLVDPFHDIKVTVVIRSADLTIPGRATMRGLALRGSLPGQLLHRRPRGRTNRAEPRPHVREKIGGESGCPYVVELVLQACQFALVAVMTGQAREAILEKQDLEAFAGLRQKMGQCAGHRELAPDRLPAWLEREQRQGR